MGSWWRMVAGEPDMTPFLRKILGMNWVLVLVMYGLLIFGVFMIESAARHLSVSKENLDPVRQRGRLLRLEAEDVGS